MAAAGIAASTVVEGAVAAEETFHPGIKAHFLTDPMGYHVGKYLWQPLIGPKEFEALINRFPVCAHDVHLGFESIPRKIEGAIEIILRRLKIFKRSFNICQDEDLPIEVSSAYIERASTDEEKGIRFIKAAQLGFYGMCRFVLEKNPAWLTREVLGRALIKAAKANHIDVVDILLTFERHNEITAENFGIAFELAAEYGHISILKTLLSCKRHAEISTGNFGNAFQRAAIKGRISVVETLLTSERHNEISAGNLGYSLWQAAKNGHASIVATILAYQRHAEISVENLGLALIDAASYGHTAIIEALLTYERHNEITAENLGTAFIWAAEKRHISSVIALLKYENHNKISIAHLEYALRKATANGFESITSEISTYMREQRSMERK